MPPSIPLGGLGLTLISCCLTATVVGNAYYQKKQFYPSVVYITKSNPSMAAIYLMAFTLVILFGKMLKKIFFGTLRAAESEHLIERFFYAVTETCLAFTVFRDDFSPKFVALFTILLFLKAFHWLADYRVDFMERSPVITRIFHIRVASLLILLSTIDILLIRHAYHSTMSVGASVQLVFGFEYAILLTVAYNIGVKYICHSIDLQSENPWENKAIYLLYTELSVVFIKVLLYLVFLFIMVKIYTFPLFIIRPMYLTMKSFKKALQDILQSRRAIHNMNTLYPNATEQDLRESDTVCIICRDEMLLNAGVKKLPCNHLFHAICLRSWFQRQQTCPTCRLDVLRPTPSRGPTTDPAPPQTEAPAAPNNENPQQQPQIRGRPANPPFMDFFQQLVNQAQQRDAANPNPRPNSNGNQSNTGTRTNPTVLPLFSPQLLQQMRQQHSQPSSSFTLPPMPPPPANYSGLTTEELREMEGRERRHITKRLEALQNVSTLVNAAMLQLSQYHHLVNAMDPTPTVSDNRGGESRPTSQDSSQPNTENNSSTSSSLPTNTEDTSPSSRNKQEPGTSKQESETIKQETGTTNQEAETTKEETAVTPEENTAEEVRRRRLEHFVDSNH